MSVTLTSLWCLIAATDTSSVATGTSTTVAQPGPARQRPVEPTADNPEAARVTLAPGRGLRVETADGEFGVRLGARLQVRYSILDDDAPARQVLTIRRARLKVSGHLFGEHNRVVMQLALSPEDVGADGGGIVTEAPVLDGYLVFDHLRDAAFRLGQHKVPLNRERMMSSADLAMVDRSLVDDEFTLDRDVGVEVYSDDLLGLGVVRYNAGLYTGEGRGTFELGNLGLLYHARVDVLPLGPFDHLDPADLDRGPPKLAVGASYAFIDDARLTRGTRGELYADGGTADMRLAVADLLLHAYGVSLQAEMAWREADREGGEDGPAEAPRNGLGWFVQLAGLAPGDLLVAARYSEVRPLGEDSGLEKARELGGGLSWYVFGPALRVTGDYFRQWNGVGFRQGRHRVRLQVEGRL